MGELKKRFVAATRLAVRALARKRGLSRADARAAARGLTATHVEKYGGEVMAREGTPAAPPSSETPGEPAAPPTFWDRVRLFWKNWGPMIMQIAALVLPALLGARAVAPVTALPLQVTDPAKAAHYDEFLADLLDDLGEDAAEDEVSDA